MQWLKNCGKASGALMRESGAQTACRWGWDADFCNQRIRDLREDRDLTQAQVGAAIGVPQRTYAYYESGQRMVPPHVLCALADFYDVSVDYLLGRSNKRK